MKRFLTLVLFLAVFGLSIQKSQLANIKVSANPGQKRIEVPVNFKSSFFSIPRVLLYLRDVDLNIGNQFGFELIAEAITTEGFILVINVNEFSDLNTLGVNYFATTDSNIQFFNFRADINEISGNRKKDYWSEDMQLPFEDIQGQIFLNGFQFTKKTSENYLLDLSIVQILPTSVNFQVAQRNGKPANFDWITFTIVATNGDYFDQQNYNRIQSRADDRFTFGNGLRSDNFSLQNSPRETDFNIFGLGGFELQPSSRLALRIENPENLGDNLQFQISTNFDTKPVRFSVKQMFYTPSIDCAILYTECNFEGQSLQVCEDNSVRSFSSQNWEGVQIKSISIPFGRTLTLYDRDNLEGDSTQFTTDQECLEDHTWVFE